MSLALKLKKSHSPRVFKIFKEINLMVGHKGLAEIAKNHKINVETLDSNEFLIFINRRKSAAKILIQNHSVFYLKTKINADAIAQVPTYFGGAPMKLDRNAIRQLNSEIQE